MAALYIFCLVTVVIAFVICFIEIIPFTYGENSDKQASALFLTPLLESNEITKAQQLSRVTPDIANTTSFSGYFTVDKECESNLFFWFFHAQSNWEKAPVLLWLQGGPGSSSLFGLFNEIGPFFYEGKNAIKREHSWNKKLNLLFIDQPVNTGFSYSGKDCYAENKTDIVEYLYSALNQFFQLFPLLRENKFYVAGESYAGHYVPYIAHCIHNKNPTTTEKINLSGLMIGNGWMDSYYQSDYGDLLYNLGLIDEDQKKVLDTYLEKYRAALSSKDLKLALNLTTELETEKYYDLEKINIYNIMQDEPDRELYQDSSISDFSFLKRDIHVDNNNFSIDRPGESNERYYAVVDNLLHDQMMSVTREVQELLEHYPILFYFGQMDTVCPYSSALGFLQNLRWSGAEEYKQAPRLRWCVDGKLAGFRRGSHNLYEVLVRNSGHSVPVDQPLWAFALADSFTSSPPEDPLQGLQSC